MAFPQHNPLKKKKNLEYFDGRVRFCRNSFLKGYSNENSYEFALGQNGHILSSISEKCFSH